ncbi:30S ribosomal protein S7 [Niastella populi]|uniref:Small ribosomal subunit protein uS7 n=1 Tax=Niastella populi TaxID=550983 RepID=A0A1V9FLZ3_9BACT|nr:30S ribosomal protein S7 [Niastella populi]OQP59327.1 30S ribosomal protein S7 [Niastella populi]
MRKTKVKKIPLAPDARYNDLMVTRFINNLMWEGKKNTAFNLFYTALDRVSKTTGENGYEIWKKALSNVTPAVEVRSRRIGGATFQIPAEVRADRKVSLSMKWLIRYSRERNGRSMSEKLANEIIAASKGEGGAYKKKEDTHRMAEANKAFAHFRV